METQLFPNEIIENSQEANFSKHSVSSKVIYCTIVLSVMFAMVLLPFIYVDVGVRSQGLIRPATEVIQISAPVSGHIKQLHATENSYLSSGELIAVIDSPDIAERIRFNKNRQKQVKIFLHDLNILQDFEYESIDHNNFPILTSPRYKRAYLEYRQTLLNHKQETDRQKRLLDRERILLEGDATSQSALEEKRFSFETALNRLQLAIEQQLNKWRLEQDTYEIELSELVSELQLIKDELSQHEIRSPVSGTFQNSAGFFSNTFVVANQVLGEISPDTSLIAESYVSPRDIGLLRAGMPVKIQIDAYNYNQWGIATGRIESISTDMMMMDGQPVFRVRSSLEQSHLQLQNGFKGKIKKGMTFQGRFIVSRRSLFQLLYDKVDDWLNPAWGENESLVQTVNQ